MNFTMNFHVVCFLILLLLLVISLCTTLNINQLSKPGYFLVYRTNLIAQRTCTCKMSFSCSCCEHVVILYERRGKNLCVNFTYQRNGLNVDISLDSDIIRNISITNYKPFRSCVSVPRCFFSTACASIVELNQFSRSITACLHLEILAKKERWQLNYNCISISKDLPMVTLNTAMNSEIPAITAEMSSEETSATMQMETMISSMITEQMSTTTTTTVEETTGTLEIIERTYEPSVTTEMISIEMTEITPVPDEMPTETSATNTEMIDTAMETMTMSFEISEVSTEIVVINESEETLTVPP